MQQRKALLALAMLLALLTFNTEVQAKGGRGGGSRSSGGHRSSSSGGGFFSSWGKNSKSSSSHDSGGGGSSGGGFFSNFGGKSKSSSSSSHKNSDSGSDNTHLHKPIKPSKIGNHHSKPTHSHHAASYPRQPVFMTSRTPGAPPPPPPPGGGYYASSSSLPVGAVYYPQVPRTSSDPGFADGFFAGAYGQRMLDRLSHAHYYGGHRSVIHHHYNQNENDNNNNGGKDTIIIINNNPATVGDLEQANTTTTTTTTTTTPLELGTQFAPIQPVLTNDVANAFGPIFEANVTNLPGPADTAAISTMIINTDVPDGNATTAMGATLNDNISTAAAAAASNGVDDNNQAVAPPPPGGIICFPSMVNETDAQDPNKVLQVEKIFCFPSEPPALTEEELQQQPPEQPNILNEDQQNLEKSTSSGSNNKGSYQFVGVMVLLYLRNY